ncbi:MAG TPA: hypothetical protein PLE30_11480 [Candidatus Kapabacteria bacterium]|nr:hypothetical protein [Candidatus Kapabacteria bacterium]
MRRNAKMKYQWFLKRKMYQKILIIIIPIFLIYPFFYLLANLGMVFLLVFGDYFIKETYSNVMIVHNKKEIGILEKYYCDTTWSIEIRDFPPKSFYFNNSKILFNSKMEITRIYLINKNTDSVAVIIFYNNPGFLSEESRIIEFIQYNHDSIGVYNYIWDFDLLKPRKFNEDTIIINRIDMIKYKKCDTIYLKQYLN